MESIWVKSILSEADLHLPSRLHSYWQGWLFSMPEHHSPVLWHRSWPPRTSTQGPIQSWKTWCPWNESSTKTPFGPKAKLSQNCLLCILMPLSMQCRNVPGPSATSRQAPCWSPFRTALEPTVSWECEHLRIFLVNMTEGARSVENLAWSISKKARSLKYFW